MERQIVLWTGTKGKEMIEHFTQETILNDFKNNLYKRGKINAKQKERLTQMINSELREDFDLAKELIKNLIIC